MMKKVSRAAFGQGCPFLHGPRSEASGYVMDDAPPENVFRDAIIAFAEKYAP
ncbi:MAG: hypothetical protein JXA15_14235 [Spirochaetales bacterium]|nr:hypothetical protein [Spirochaetales bacterium]